MAMVSVSTSTNRTLHAGVDCRAGCGQGMREGIGRG